MEESNKPFALYFHGKKIIREKYRNEGNVNITDDMVNSMMNKAKEIDFEVDEKTVKLAMQAIDPF